MRIRTTADFKQSVSGLQTSRCCPLGSGLPAHLAGGSLRSPSSDLGINDRAGHHPLLSVPMKEGVCRALRGLGCRPSRGLPPTSSGIVPALATRLERREIISVGKAIVIRTLCVSENDRIVLDSETHIEDPQVSLFRTGPVR